MDYSYSIACGGAGGVVLLTTSRFYCNENEDYLIEPAMYGSISYEMSGGDTRSSYTDSITTSETGRYSAYIRQAGNNAVIDSQNTFLFISSGEALQSQASVYPAPGFNTDNAVGASGIISTNIPIFLTQSEANTYNAADDLTAKELIKNAINYYGGADNEKDTADYWIYNTFDTCNIEMGQVTYTGGDPTGRFEIFKANTEPVLYYVDKDNSLELVLIASDIVGSVYSSINRYDVINKQYDVNNWQKKSLVYTGPWYHTLDYLPDGSYTIGVTWESNILIFDDETKALGYLAGTVPAEDAVNYGNVGRPQIASNETGTKENATIFGGNMSQNVFSNDYVMSRNALVNIATEFFDNSIIEALLDGLRLYGNDPMNSVMSCVYFPFNLASICNLTSVNAIAFGAYKMNVTGVNKVTTRQGYKSLGSTYIKPTFYNWLDYVAMHIYLYLPYIGFVELDVNKYLEKTLEIIYMVDIHSGECEVSLLADDLLMDTYSGQIGIKQPLSWQDLSTYFQTQITALRNGVMTSLGMPAAGAMAGGQVGGPYGAIAGAGAGSLAAMPNAFWTGYKFGNTKPPLFSKGGYSSEIGANMPQYAFLVFVYNDVVTPENELQLVGKPSNESGAVSKFSGFLACNYVQLQCAGATEAEKNEIMTLLTSGIYI